MKNTFTRAHIAEALTEAGFTGAQADLAVTTMIDAIAEAITTERQIEIRGMFSVKTKHAAARRARNPLTGEAVEVPEKLRIRVKISKELTAKLNAHKE
jgi:integration host factor subunit beta